MDMIHVCKSLQHMISTHLDYLRCDAIRVNSIHLGSCHMWTCKQNKDLHEQSHHPVSNTSSTGKPRRFITCSVYLYKLGMETNLISGHPNIQFIVTKTYPP